MQLEKIYSGKKAVVTGGLGFLGSTLALELHKLGARVTAVDSLLENHGGNPFNLEGFLKAIEWVQADIRDASKMKEILKGQDFLFNIAAQTSHTDSMKNPFLDTDINTRGQMALLEACREINPTIRIIYCSTRAVYGAVSERVINETVLPNPLDIYATHKLSGEFYHKIYSRAHGVSCTILRVANGYGPRAQMKAPSFGILNWFIRLAIDNSEIKIFGDGKQVRDYVYGEDIIQAFLMVAARNDLNGEVLNVGSGVGVPLIDIVKKVVKLAGKGKIVYVPWPETNKKIDVGDFIADIQKIKMRVSWESSTGLDDGLSKTIQFYEKNRSHYW